VQHGGGKCALVGDSENVTQDEAGAEDMSGVRCSIILAQLMPVRTRSKGDGFQEDLQVDIRRLSHAACSN
jgi:hypothetical protein